MTQQSDSERLSSFVLGLYGEDPYAHVYRASEEHREAHGSECEVYPSSPLSMRLVSLLIRATAAKRILEIGCGLGYSALHLAAAADPDGSVDTIDRFPEHVSLALENVSAAGFSQRIRILQGEGDNVLPTLSGSYDLVYDDGWFVQEPAYLETMLDLIRPGGLLVMSNWFPLQDAVLGHSDVDWSGFSDPDWADRIQAYARKLAAHPQISISFVLRPWLGLAVKTA
ncbi:MAG: class I SAM-dependent methyltransferase [Chloroflexi bacterium]|nr:class I SAM-dependent methyltransferase [Chloroflexota bacterium]